MSSISYLDIGNLGAAFIEVKVGEEISTVQGEGTQPPSLLSPPGPGSVRLCNAMETQLPHSPSLSHPAS